MDTFNYWLQRFWPLIKRKMQHEVDLDGGVAPDSPKRIIIVFANRSGEDPPADETKPPVQYVGSSTILAITQRPEKDADAGSGASESETEDDLPFDVKILCWDMLGAREEGICFADTTADPKMVFALKRASK
jgi:protein N-terminal amidase